MHHILSVAHEDNEVTHTFDITHLLCKYVCVPQIKSKDYMRVQLVVLPQIISPAHISSTHYCVQSSVTHTRAITLHTNMFPNNKAVLKPIPRILADNFRFSLMFASA